MGMLQAQASAWGLVDERLGL
ncbi:unnamed protein product, partial [Didymodactylos carnosus]